MGFVGLSGTTVLVCVSCLRIANEAYQHTLVQILVKRFLHSNNFKRSHKAFMVPGFGGADDILNCNL